MKVKNKQKENTGSSPAGRKTTNQQLVVTPKANITN